MDNFESLIRLLIEHDGYWTRQSHKVNVTKEEKRRIGKPSIPRPEIDLLAFDSQSNTVIALEVKSFLDSPGVTVSDLREIHEIPNGRYKLFTCENYRNIVFQRLHEDLVELGLANKSTKITLGLAAGNVRQNKSTDLEQLFASRSWFLLTPENIKAKLKGLANIGYENDPFVISAKVICR